MSRRGWVKLECDLCGEPDSYPVDKPWSTADDGWTWEEQADGRILDLCPRCTRDVDPLCPSEPPTGTQEPAPPPAAQEETKP